jgi:16S rRNA (guanine966-N2)-methyltransferase
MRIVAGDMRGRKLIVPEGTHVRPTTDRVREALFNILQHGDHPIANARVLDLFAGSGALGLEALSRGAAYAVFVDDHSASRAAIRRNVEALGVTGCTKIFRRDAAHLGDMPNGAQGPFDLIFLDPPYAQGLVDKAIQSARDGGWIAPSAQVIVECGEGETLELPELVVLNERIYGDTKVLFLQAP